MALAAAIGSAAVGVSGIWGYNRENFLYDREMRQLQEFKVLEMRLKQADLWREDVRDLIGLTEKKMDSYMVVNALQLGFCVVMFAEGKLEPGTPEWLMWLYMLSLAGAFAMLLMSVWMAMHASVVAQGSSVRLLTQLVRPAVPSWEQVEAMRTYAHAFEGTDAAQMMRIPVLQTIKEGRKAGTGGHSGHSDAPPGTAASDPWGLERRGDDIYELGRRPIPANRHVRLIREAMRHSQAYDAFARVTMTLGTVLLCNALEYYMLGYALVQDGSPWAAWAAVLVFMAIASMLVQLDLSATAPEHALLQMFLHTGPVLASVAAAEWATYRTGVQRLALPLLPGAFVSHAAFLLVFLHACRIRRQQGGAMLPTGFRSVLYLDVFGWLTRDPVPGKMAAPSQDDSRHDSKGSRSSGPEVEPTFTQTLANYSSDDDGSESDSTAGCEWRPGLAGMADKAGSQHRMALVHGQTFPRHFQKRPVALRPEDVDAAPMNPADPHGCRLARKAAAEALQEDLDAFDKDDRDVQLPGVGPPGVVQPASPAAFEPASFGPGGRQYHRLGRALRSGRDLFSPGQGPWFVFRSAALSLSGLWLVGAAWVVGQMANVPDVPDRLLPAAISIEGKERRSRVVLEGVAGNREAQAATSVPTLAGQRVLLEWPTERFQPWALGCDSECRRFAISDEFQLYSAHLVDGPAETPLPQEAAAFSVGGLASSDSTRSSSLARDGTGSNEDKLGPAPPLSTPPRLADVRLSPRCAALEGQAMRDVGVVCPSDGGKPQPCSALVLHERGTRLAECPLNADAVGAGPLNGSGGAGFVVGRLWNITHDWLRSKHGRGADEEVVSIAVDTACAKFDPSDTDNNSSGAAINVAGGWCSVVGTTQGRMVRLRHHVRRPGALVPDGAIWNVLDSEDLQQHGREQVLATSLLHSLPGGRLLKLKDERRSIQAISIATGQMLGEWQLPQVGGWAWSVLAGGGKHLYIIRQMTNGDQAELWQFPLPAELRAP